MLIKNIELGEPVRNFSLVDSKAGKDRNPSEFKFNNTFTVQAGTLYGGKQEGVKFVDIDNGSISARILPSLGSSVKKVIDSKSGRGWMFQDTDVTGPQFLDSEARGGIKAFLDNFGPIAGNLAGGIHAGPASRVTSLDNTGSPTETLFPLHGYLGVTPASNVDIDFIKTPTPAIVLTTVHKEGHHMFGPYLTHTIEFIFPLAENRFHIKHTIKNESSNNQEIMAMYHLNQATQPGSKIISPIDRLRARDNGSNVSAWNNGTYQLSEFIPGSGHAEEVSYASLHTDADGRTISAVIDSDEKNAVSFSYNVNDLPHTTFWISDNFDGVAIEPGLNHSVVKQRLLKAKGKEDELGISPIRVLRPGESHTMTTEVTIHKDIQPLVEEIFRLSAGRNPTIINEPLFKPDEAR